MSLYEELQQLPESEIKRAVAQAVTDAWIGSTESSEQLAEKYPALASMSEQVKDVLTNLHVSPEKAELISLGCTIGSLALVDHAGLEDINKQFPEIAEMSSEEF